MILPDPAWSTDPDSAVAGLTRQAIVLLYRARRSPDDDTRLLALAEGAWQQAARIDDPRRRIATGLLLAQVQCALGRHHAVIDTANQLRCIARHTAMAQATAVRALTLAAQSWRALAEPDRAEHVRLIVELVIATTVDAGERRRLRTLADNPTGG